MKDKIVMGFDFGTNGVKALAYSRKEKKLLVSAYKSYPVLTPEKNFMEQDPRKWWEAFRWCVRVLLQQGGFSKEEVKVISVSSHTPTLTPLDEKGVPLCNGAIWSDGRAGEVCRRLQKEYAREIQKRNPACIRPYHILPKLLWFRENRPELYKKTKMFVDCNNYINYRLTGVFALDRSMAVNYHFYNVHTKEWDEKLAEELGIKLEQFPALVDCGQVIGHLGKEAAEELSLDEKTEVLGGASDTAMAMAGMGIFTQDRLAYSCGTGSTVIMLAKNTKENWYEADPALLSLGFVNKDYLMNIGVMSNTGGAFQWMKEAVCEMDSLWAKTLKKDVFSIMSDHVTAAPLGAGGIVFLPYLAGELSPLYEPDARGVFFGLNTKTTKQEMLRAVMEGTCYAVLQNVEIVLKAMGKKKEEMKEIVATGGPCHSSAWMQMLSDILGIRVQTQEKAEGAAIGDVILAAVSAGIFENMEEAAREIIVPGACYEPDEERGKKYRINYQTYVELQKVLLPCFKEHQRRWRENDM